jgi:hypothetical protein
MAIQLQGNAGVVGEVESATRAMRVTTYPLDPLTLGYYAMAPDNGTTVMTAGLAANSPIFSFRWGNANLCLLRSIRLSFTTVTAFASGRMDFAAFFARGFTASDTAGTAITLTGNNGKKRTAFGTTLLTDMRISATATLTAGTRTLDAQPFGRLATNTTVAATSPFPPGTFLWERDASDEYPMTFAQNEGFVIQATVPATGTWFFSVQVEWMEIASF